MEKFNLDLSLVSQLGASPHAFDLVRFNIPDDPTAEKAIEPTTTARDLFFYIPSRFLRRPSSRVANRVLTLERHVRLGPAFQAATRTPARTAVRSVSPGSPSRTR